MNKLKEFIRAYWKIFLLFSLILLITYIAFLFKVDKKIIAFSLIIVGFLTQLFAELLAIIALVPIIGPIVVKIISIPIIIIINGIGYIVTFLAFKKGYKVEVAKSKMFTTALLIGIIIGFIIGKII